MMLMPRRILHIMLLLAVLIATVTAKGNKIRIKKPNTRKDPNRGRGSVGSDASGSSSTDNIAPFLFRNASHEERLLAYLFRDYDPVARAVMDTNKTVVVTIDFVLLRIHGLDERSQVLTTTGLVIAEWLDDRLVWDPEKFGNVLSIIVRADKLWLPELAVMNGAEELMPDFDRIRVLLNHDGLLHWEPGGIFRTTCDIDISYFPFDMQHCPLLIGAYSYYSNKMNITNRSNKMITHDFKKNGEWHVYGTNAKWAITILDPCCVENGYAHVIFEIHLRRRSKFYVMNIVLPCLMLSVLIMIGFYLPPDAGEKISLGISVLLAFTVFLLMIADNIPRTSLAIPLMVIYLTATMTLGTISVCMSVLVLNVHHRDESSPVPYYLKKLVLTFLARLVCVKTSKASRHRTPKRERDKDEFLFSERRHRSNHHHPNVRLKSSNLNTNGGLGMDEYELIGLTVNNVNKPTLPITRAHIPNTSLNGPRMTTIPVTPPNIQNERRRYPRRRNVTPPPKKEEESEKATNEWHELAYVLDRLFFWILFLLMTLSAIFTLLFTKYTGVEAELLALADSTSESL